MAAIYMCYLSKWLSPVPQKCHVLWHLTRPQEHPKMNLKDKYCSCESFCHDSNNFKIAKMYSSNNVKIVLMQDKMVVLVSIIFTAACNFLALVTILRWGKIMGENVFAGKSALLLIFLIKNILSI